MAPWRCRAFTLLALDLFLTCRGLAASCQSFTQMGLNASTAAVVALALWASTGLAWRWHGGLPCAGACRLPWRGGG